MLSGKRKSGIAVVEDLPWGSHFCLFYETKTDWLDVLVNYFRAGLENNEFCLWVSSGTLAVEDVRKALEKAVPRLDEFAAKGQMEFLSYKAWQAKGRNSDAAVVSALDKAIYGGFDGLRLACDALHEKAGGKSFTGFGTEVMGGHNVIAAFAYPRDRFDALGLMQVVKSHRFALVPNAGRLEVIESSEARTVKDELKRSEEKLKFLFSNMSEGFAYHRILLDAAGKPIDYVFLELNGAFERLTGLKAKEVLGKRVTQVLPGIESDPTDWIGKYGKVALTGRPAQFESRSEALDKWYAVSAFSTHKGYFAVTFSDITERKQAEEEIRRAAAFNEAAMKSLGEGLYTIDENGLVTSMNPAAEQLFGWTFAELHGKKMHDMTHHHYHDGRPFPSAECAGFQVLTHGIPLMNYEDVFIHKEGTFFDVIYSIAPLREAGGKITGLVVVFSDITERKRAEAEVRQLNLELEQRVAALDAANKELDAFAYSVSHDLRAPLRGMDAFSRILVDKLAHQMDQDARHCLQMVRDNALQMGRLIDDLLAFSRLSQVPLTKELIRHEALVDSALASLEAERKGRQIDFQVGELPAAEADPRLLKQVWVNLIANALKYTRGRDKAEIRIGSEAKNGVTVYFVQDNGVGFDMRYAHKLFGVFQRLHRAEDYEGTGVGLAIVRRIVGRHGGRIWARAVKGEGATFYFTLTGADDLA